MTAPVLRVDTRSPVPPYEQIRAGLAALIRTGGLAEGERLPTVRQLAADLGLATGTVARAYRELEAAGLVRTRRGAGTRVAPRPSAPTPYAPERLAELALRYARQARTLGAPDDAITAALRDALAATPPPTS